MADHCRVLEVFRTMFIQLQEHVLCMKAPSMYGVTPTSALGVYKAKILILNGIIKKMDESEFSLIISIEPLGVSCRQPQSLTEKSTGSISPAASSRLGPQPQMPVITLKIRGNKIISEVSVSILMCEHTLHYGISGGHSRISRRKRRNVSGSLNHSVLTLQNLSAQPHHLLQSAMAEFPLN